MQEQHGEENKIGHNKKKTKISLLSESGKSCILIYVKTCLLFYITRTDMVFSFHLWNEDFLKLNFLNLQNQQGLLISLNEKFNEKTNIKVFKHPVYKIPNKWFILKT